MAGGGRRGSCRPPTSQGLSSAPPDATLLKSGEAMWDRTLWGPAYEEQRRSGSHCADLIFSTVCPGSCSGKCHPHALLTLTGAPSHSPPQPSQPSARTGSNCPLILASCSAAGGRRPLLHSLPGPLGAPHPLGADLAPHSFSALVCLTGLIPGSPASSQGTLMGVPPQHRPECQTTKGKDPKCRVPDQLSWCPQAL